MIVSERIFRCSSFLKTYCDLSEREVNEIDAYDFTHEELRKWLDENGYENYWDYPLSEYDYLAEEKSDSKFVIVCSKTIGRFYEVKGE